MYDGHMIQVSAKEYKHNAVKLLERVRASGEVVQITKRVRIPVTEEAVFKSRSLGFHHEDPFDRIIAGTAVTENVPLMTADRNLLKLEWPQRVPAV
jgi:PIN domain nuclease of toxin-antitoxin system